MSVVVLKPMGQLPASIIQPSPTEAIRPDSLPVSLRRTGFAGLWGVMLIYTISICFQAVPGASRAHLGGAFW